MVFQRQEIHGGRVGQLETYLVRCPLAPLSFPSWAEELGQRISHWAGVPKLSHERSAKSRTEASRTRCLAQNLPYDCHPPL